MNDQQKRILVTGAGGPLGVNVTRSLLSAPEPIFLLGTEANRYHVPMSLTHETELIPLARETDAYLASLNELIERHDIDLLLPTHPVEVRTVAGNRDSLTGVKLVLPGIETIEIAQSKWRTWQLLEEAGVPVPPTYLIAGEEDLERAFAAIETRPVWVRGAGVPGFGIGVASLPCREVAHAAAWIDHFRGWGGFIASEFLPGRNLTWLGLFFEGELIACQGRERHEYVIPHVSPSGITGAPAVSCTVSRGDIRSVGEAAVRGITKRPHGPFFVDMTEDREGRPRVTEINGGRFGTTIHFYTEAGFNFPWLLVRLGLGQAVEGAPIVDPVAPDTWWLRTIDCGPVLVRGLDGGE
jgi:carbamoyl-phosphate synthase large subunit